MKTLQEIADKHKPNKQLFNYIPLYERYLTSRRLSAKSILEIGVLGGNSLRMWKEYFSNAQIYGVDINPKCINSIEKRIEIRIGDQNDEEFLKVLPWNLDIIIDDGSHKPIHMIKTFEYLFKEKLNRNGLYIIEDMLGRHHNVVVNYLKQLVDKINFRSDNPQLKTVKDHYLAEDTNLSWWDRNILGISFYRYIAFIQKGKNPGDETIV